MSISSLTPIQLAMTRYVLPSTLGLGNAGNLILLMVFSQKHHRKNPCALYLFTAAVCSIVGSNWAVVPLIYSADHPDPLTTSVTLCRVRGYVIHSCAMSFRTMIVLAAVDRWALTHSRPNPRSWSSIVIARKLVIAVPLFWFSASVHLLIFADVQNGRCFVWGLYGQIYSYYQLICFGILPTVFQILFTILTLKHLKSSRNRVHVNGERQANSNVGPLRRRDQDLLRLVTTEIIVSFICIFPYTINSIYTVLFSNVANKSVDRVQIESFLVFITMWFLLYLKYSTTFYSYITTSAAFRAEVKDLFRKAVRKLTNKVNVTAVTRVQTLNGRSLPR